MSAVEKLLETAKAEVGYLEKKSDSQLDSKTNNAGSNNYTRYAAELYPSLQGQPWCDMFVDWCFMRTFGEVTAQRLLGGGYSAYTPTSAQYYKNKGRYYKSDPLPGDQIFFRNDIRIYHTGIVDKVTSSKVYTVEGNTSSGTEVIANGGAVCKKEYALTNSRIDGYGRPDWSLVEQPEYTMGWNHDANGWWYADSKTTYHRSCWQLINHHWYYFNLDGYAVTGWQVIDGKDYYFEPRTGHELECAMYVTDSNGAQGPGEF
ncbi:CHAP domain-containing protein [Lachnospiraceae bacterium 54-53]